MRPLLGIPLMVLLAQPVATADSGTTGQLPAFDAQDARAAAVSASTLLSNERFWPYQVALTQDGSVGVLIRVESGGQARIDFGRDGLRNVPVSDTDLVERANRVRLGELEKRGPNFLLAIGPRILDSSASVPRAFPIDLAAGKPGFISVFADPRTPGFSEMAKTLAPLSERHGVMTILFPQGRVSDVDLSAQLRALGWTIPFVLSHLSEPYTRTLLSSALRPPAVMLQTDEGRVLFESDWREGLAADLTSAIDATFGARTASIPATNSH